MKIIFFSDRLYKEDWRCGPGLIEALRAAGRGVDTHRELPAEVIEVARRIEQDRTFRKNTGLGPDYSWRRRARDLVDIANAAEAGEEVNERQSNQCCK